MSEYPEHDKLKTVAEKSQAAGEVLAWLFDEKQYFLAEDAGQVLSAGFGTSYTATRIRPICRAVKDLLAEFFEIDQKILEAEKRAMLAAMREAQQNQEGEGERPV